MARGCSSMVEHQPSKLDTRVRFPSPAPRRCGRHIVRSDFLQKSLLTHSVAAPFSFKTHGFEADFCFLASVTSLALTFIHPEKSQVALAGPHFFPNPHPSHGIWICFLSHFGQHGVELLWLHMAKVLDTAQFLRLATNGSGERERIIQALN